MSELQQNGEKRANEFAKKLEGKDQLMKKAKKFVSVTKEKLLKKEGEVEELNKELLSMKGKSPRLRQEFNFENINLNFKHIEKTLEKHIYTSLCVKRNIFG